VQPTRRASHVFAILESRHDHKTCTPQSQNMQFGVVHVAICNMHNPKLHGLCYRGMHRIASDCVYNCARSRSAFTRANTSERAQTHATAGKVCPRSHAFARIRTRAIARQREDSGLSMSQFATCTTPSLCTRWGALNACELGVRWCAFNLRVGTRWRFT
jgi:hypothetical protein